MVFGDNAAWCGVVFVVVMIIGCALERASSCGRRRFFIVRGASSSSSDSTEAGMDGPCGGVVRERFSAEVDFDAAL